MIEYALIAVLVILGIVFMGPYVLRSVNAHFKLWDESVQDSFTENITQAPISVIPNIPINCKCTNSNGGCGGGVGSQCGANQQTINHNCNPELCDGAPLSSCVIDNSCCSVWADEGCGTFPCPATGCSNAPESPPPASNNCYYGQEMQGQTCGSNNAIQCIQSAACPLPKCLGILSPGATACPNEPPANGGNLTQNIGITYVASQATCHSPCQYYCDGANSYFINATGTSCTRTFKVAASLSSCAGGCNGPGQGCSSSTVNGTATTTNNCSFSMCAAPTTTITTISITDISSPETSPYCKNPGNPGEQCEVSVTY